jgi:hypothetical protein
VTVRVIVLLGVAAAFAIAGESQAQSRRRQPYDAPKLLPHGDPFAMRRDEPWQFKADDPFAIKQEPYPYTTPQSRSRVEKEVRDYDPGRRFGGYTPPAPSSGVATPKSRAGGYCNRLFEDC